MKKTCCHPIDTPTTLAITSGETSDATPVQTPGSTPGRMQKKVKTLFAWLLPGAFLLLVPKCPACFAAYIALGTGLTLSFSTATYLRWALLFLCVSALLFLVAKQLPRISTLFINRFKKDPQQCNIKS